MFTVCFFSALRTGDAAEFILHLADRIRYQGGENGQLHGEEAIDTGERLADISELLGISDTDLDSARHPKDITKTVRQITKMVYPDINDRCAMKISTMDQKIVQAIMGKDCFSYCKVKMFYQVFLN